MTSVSLVAEPPRPSFSPEQVARLFFSPQVDDNGESASRFLCKVCKNTYKQADGRGYSNLMQHIRAKHTDYEEQMRSASSSETGSLLSWVSFKAHNHFSWIEWVVEAGLPCQSFYNSTKCQTSAYLWSTLRDNILCLTTAVENEIAAEMPSKIGLNFDGWTRDSEHYVAIFASYVTPADGVVHTPLLSLAPIINELDDDLSARMHQPAIETVLGFFGKALAQVAFLVGDNCSVNKKLARLMEVPLLGCASHRLNLAVKSLTSAFETELDKIQLLMVRLRTINRGRQRRGRF